MAGNEPLPLSDEELQKPLKVHFKLKGSGFPDNKIYAIIDIEPKSAFALVEKFIFLLNDSPRAEFPSEYRTISISGFDRQRKKLSAVVGAKLIGKKENELVESEAQSFWFDDKVFTLSPVVKFDWSCDDKEQKKKPRLVVQWDHIGDARAHEYVLYLNEKKIYHIHHKYVEDDFKVLVQNLSVGDKYTLEIAALLINGKESYRSDQIEFTVPTEDKKDDDEVIIVLNETIPYNLPVIGKDQSETRMPTKPINQKDRKRNSDVPTKNSPCSSKKEFDSFRLEVEPLLAKLKKQIEFRNSCLQRYRFNLSPHEKFLGVSHYFSDDFTILKRAPGRSLGNKATHSTPAPNNHEDFEKESDLKDKYSDQSNGVLIVPSNTDATQ